MVINEWDSRFIARYGSTFPSSYLCFDTEFTGRSVTNDLVVEIGHVLVEDGKVIDRLNLILNWYDHPQAHTFNLDYRLNIMKKRLGDDWKFTPQLLKTQGINPLKALKFYHKLFKLWADRKMFFVAQNGVNADEAMLRGNFSRFINKSFDLPEDGYFDTGAIFKAFSIWNSESENVKPYKSYILPGKHETLKSYFSRVCNTRITGVYWSLKFILEHFNLLQKHNLSTSDLHSAGFDALCLHYIMEEYRNLSVSGKANSDPKATDDFKSLPPLMRPPVKDIPQLALDTPQPAPTIRKPDSFEVKAPNKKQRLI
jgi:hypothetical protein